MIPMPEVEPCLPPQIYQDDNGKWWRYCLTCDDGSNKYGRHIRGHRTEADARMSARDHVRQATANRRMRAWFVLWREALVNATTWEEFTDIYEQRKVRGWPRPLFENVPVERRPELMTEVQKVYRREVSSE